MGFRRALDLQDFTDGLVALALLGVFVIDGTAIELHTRVHQAVGEVAVVRNGQHPHTLLSLRIQCIPQVLGVIRVQRAEGNLRHIGIPVDHVAVKVLGVRHGGPLIGDQGGKGTGVVMAICGFNHILPGVHTYLLHPRCIRRQITPGYRRCRADEGDRHGQGSIVEQAFAQASLFQHQHGLVQARRSQVFRVVGHRREIQWPVDANGIAGTVLDGTATGKDIGVIRRRARAHGIGVG